jgi:hypothetical protein
MTASSKFCFWHYYEEQTDDAICAIGVSARLDGATNPGRRHSRRRGTAIPGAQLRTRESRDSLMCDRTSQFTLRIAPE